MDDIIKKEGRYVGTYNYKSDFMILTKKEKRGILKNAKRFLKLQREAAVTLTGAGLFKEEAEMV